MKKKLRVQKFVEQSCRPQNSKKVIDDESSSEEAPSAAFENKLENTTTQPPSLAQEPSDASGNVLALEPFTLSESYCQQLSIQILEWAISNLQSPESSLTSDHLVSGLDSISQQLKLELGVETPDLNCDTILQWLLNQISHSQIVCVTKGGKRSPRSLDRLKQAILKAISAACDRRQFMHAVDEANMNSIYQLAYGLSHEINNPLANIAARAQQLIGTATPSDKKSLATIVDQAMRAHEMIAEMMRVVQPRTLSRQATDVAGLISKIAEAFEPHCEKSQIQLRKAIASGPLWAHLDTHALSAAIKCICDNAIQVCRPSDSIEIICQPWKERSSSVGLEDCVRIAIRDTGPGMTPHTAKNAWNLYFSGKEHGRGLGISLAQVKQVVHGHDGCVWIESQSQAGCTFEIRIPTCKAPNQKSKSLRV